MSSTPLVPAAQLAARAGVAIPGESAEYRKARTALLAEEIELHALAQCVHAPRWRDSVFLG